MPFDNETSAQKAGPGPLVTESSLAGSRQPSVRYGHDRLRLLVLTYRRTPP